MALRTLSNQEDHTPVAQPSGEFTVFWPGYDIPERRTNKEKRVLITSLMKGTSFGISVSELSHESLVKYGVEDHQVYIEMTGNVIVDGVCLVKVYYDGTDDTGRVYAGEPVVFDTQTATAVTGINETWEKDEYKVVGIAMEDHETSQNLHWDDQIYSVIPVRLIPPILEDAEEMHVGIVGTGGITGARKLVEDDVTAPEVEEGEPEEEAPYNPEQFSEGDILIGFGEVELMYEKKVKQDPEDDDEEGESILKQRLSDETVILKEVSNAKGYAAPGYLVTVHKDDKGVWWVEGPDNYVATLSEDADANASALANLKVNDHELTVHHDVFTGGGTLESGAKIRIRWNKKKLHWSIIGAEC